jgi:hypothetical protein
VRLVIPRDPSSRTEALSERSERTLASMPPSLPYQVCRSEAKAADLRATEGSE